MNPSLVSLILVAVVAAGCADDGANQCEIGVTSQQVLAEDRKILGAGAAFTPDGTLRGRADELHRSQKLRREVAWQTVARVLAPVSLNVALPNASGATLPSWHTWYGADDITRLFQHLYGALSPEQQQARARFDQPSIDTAFGWHVDEVDDLANWPQERWDAYVAAIDDADKVAGVGGVGRVGYSADAVRHLLRSYPDTLRCLQDGTADAFDDTPGDSVQQAVREPLALTGCASRTLGPFYVSSGERVRASLDGTQLIGARLSIHSGGMPGADDCETTGGDVCEVQGEGAYYVTVTAGVDGLSASVQVDYASPNSPWAGCLEGPFPASSVVVKTSWHRAQLERMLPVYDTSPGALDTILANNATDGWGVPSKELDPGPSDIYTMEVANGQRYRLAGLHIMTKELDHWQWITLWWSDDPDADFGQDRPAEITALPGPWRNYKMCAVTMFDERDPDPSGGFADTAPDLAAALTAVHGGVGSPSWCSNPYLEEGAHNMATNCIGCHQHGGTALTAETIIGTPDLYPAQGRHQQRNNFPDDYSWAVTAGDRLNLAFKQVVDFFDQP